MSSVQTLLGIIVSFFLIPISAQSSFELLKFPKNNQLIARNTITNIGTFSIEGIVSRAANISSLQARVSKDSILQKNYILTIPSDTNKYSFTIPIAIKAELKNYKIELIGIRNNQEVLLAKAENVVAGDVFIINGQSNCIGRIDDSDYNPFMRSYTDQFGWNDIEYTSPSKWGGRMAKQIIENDHIPVAIFCEAFGGVIQTWFMRQDTNPYTAGNYGILYNRLKKAEVEKKVRALLWWQGESDGWETPADSFKNQFKKLCSQWKEDYNTPIFYFQIRFRACTHINPGIFEAQRQLVNEISNIEIMSSNPALSHDGCHFYYENGYDSIGNQAYRLLSAKLYNKPLANTRPPNIVETFFSGSTEITVKMKNITGNLKVVGSPWADFRLEGCKAQITSGSASDYRIKLNFIGDTAGLTGLSYLCHIDSFSQNWIVNPLNVGILEFYNFPINNRQLTTIQNTEGGSAFEVFPTLVSDQLNLKFLQKQEDKHIEILNTYGQIVATQEVSANQESTIMMVSNLPSGAYIIRLSEYKNGVLQPIGIRKIFRM